MDVRRAASWCLVFLIATATAYDALAEGGREAPAQKSVTINVWKAPWLKGIPGQPVTEKSTYLDWYELLSQEFAKQYPNVTVKWTEYGWSENRDKINAGILTGQLPDLTYDETSVLLKYYYAGVGEPIDAYLTAADRSDYAQSSLRAATAPDGRVFFWPSDNCGAVTLVVNRALFRERGAVNLLPGNPDHRWTVDEFLKAAKAVTFDRNGDGTIDTYGIGIQFKDETGDYSRHGFLWSQGADIFSKDGKRFALNAPQAVAGLQLLHDLEHVHKVMPPGSVGLGTSEVTTMFWKRQIAMMPAGLNSIPGALAEGIKNGSIKADQFDIIATTYPHAPGAEPKLYAVDDGWFVFKQQDAYKRQMVMEFVRYLTNAENQKLASTALSIYPARTSVGDLFPDQPLVSFGQRLLQFAGTDANHPAYMDVRRILLPMYQAVLTKQKTPAQALADAEARAADVMKAYNK